jgi:DNA adenine methylase
MASEPNTGGAEQREGVVYWKGGKKLSAFPYPGGKTSFVDEIVRQFPKHRRYVEPFGGSAAVLLNKPPSYIEVFNDLNSDIVHFFEVVRERKEELQEWLRRTPYSRELHEQWARAFYQGERPDDDLERAGRWYYLRYTQYGGKLDRFSGFKTSIKRNEARSLRGATEHLDDVVTRFREVILENQDYREVLDRYDRPDTLFYLDPPYVETTYNYYGTGEFDHQQLAGVLAELAGYWICSYGDLPPSLKAQIIGNRRDGGGWTVQQGADHGRDAGHPPDNVMLGVSVGHPDWRERIDWLQSQPAATRFVSFEPLVQDIPEVDLEGVDWAIIGGESHPDPSERREMKPAWARRLVESCRRQDVAVFFKQHSGPRPESDIELDMGDGPQRIEEFPTLPDGVQPAPKAFLAGADGGGGQ